MDILFHQVEASQALPDIFSNDTAGCVDCQKNINIAGNDHSFTTEFTNPRSERNPKQQYDYEGTPDYGRPRHSLLTRSGLQHNQPNQENSNAHQYHKRKNRV